MTERHHFSPVEADDLLTGELCKTRGCRGTPDEAGNPYCYACEMKQLEAEEDHLTGDHDRAYDEAKDEGLL